MDNKNTAIPNRCIPYCLCGGMQVPLYLFHSAAVHIGLCHFCHRPGHDDFAGRFLGGRQNYGAGLAHIPVWDTAVRVLPGGAGGRFEQKDKSDIARRNMKRAAHVFVVTRAAFFYTSLFIRDSKCLKQLIKNVVCNMKLLRGQPPEP